MTQPAEGGQGFGNLSGPGELPNPLDLRKAQFAQKAGERLVGREAQIAQWFYEAGRIDRDAEIGAEAAAAQAATPAAAEATAAPAAAPAAEQQQKEESLGQILERCPTRMTYSWGGQHAGDREFWSPAGGPLFSTIGEGTPGIPLETLDAETTASVALRGLIKGSQMTALREVVGTKAITPDNPHRALMTSAEGGPAEPLIALSYTVTGRVRENEADQVTVETVLPASAIRNINLDLVDNPRHGRNLPRAVLAAELKRAQAAGDEKTLKELGIFEKRLKLLFTSIDAQGPNAALVRVTNVDGIAPDGMQGPDGYRREVTALPYNP